MWFGRYFTFIIARLGLMLSRDAPRQFASVKLRGKAVEAITGRSICRFFCSPDGISRRVYHLGVHYLERGNYEHVTDKPSSTLQEATRTEAEIQKSQLISGVNQTGSRVDLIEKLCST